VREIKFRAWNTAAKAMLHFENPKGIADGGDRYGMFLPAIESKMYIGGNYEIMQYTGLKDKNGKEIYEGDIVKISGPYFRKSIQEIMLIGYDTSRAWFGVVDVLHTVSLSAFDNEKDIEVIGNIYENPDLITA
jgi:uncharacterized phage protein (TIGR01671 family)